MLFNKKYLVSMWHGSDFYLLNQISGSEYGCLENNRKIGRYDVCSYVDNYHYLKLG